MHEVPSAEWQTFLEQFSCDHRAWLATVERIRSGGARQTAAAGRPLKAVTPEIHGRRSIAIAIEFQSDSRADGEVKVTNPTRVRVDDTAPSRVLELDDDRGECTRLRFRAAPLGEMLDGVAPGEV